VSKPTGNLSKIHGKEEGPSDVEDEDRPDLPLNPMETKEQLS
jgi:hypothetical protein